MRGSRVGHAWSFEVSCCAEKAFDASQLLERKTENEASFSQEYSDALNKREKEYSKEMGNDFLECSRMLISRLDLGEDVGNIMLRGGRWVPWVMAHDSHGMTPPSKHKNSKIYGFQLLKTSNYQPKSAWLKLKKADEIMRINGTLVWILNKERVVKQNWGQLKVTFRR